MMRAAAGALMVMALYGAVSDAQGPTRPDPREALTWRPIGPFRGGRTKSAVGVPSRPGTFYIGAVNGGIWRTTDFGHTWKPVADAMTSGSIGALDVSKSNPSVLYAGSGEGMQRPDLSIGNGLWRSTDDARTWTHLGLEDAQQITRIVIDPKNPNRLFIAVLGHPYGPNVDRGIFRSTDGGRTIEKVLYRNENTGAAEVVMSPDDPNTLWAVLWESRQAPWENGVFSGPGSGLFKTTDGGTTWTRQTVGLPTFEQDQLGRIGLAVAPGNANRLYATVDARNGKGGIYRSDDGGASWTRTTSDDRVWGRASDFAALTVDPKNPDIVWSANVVTWRSTDAGATWTAMHGAPGGDDYQGLWIDPNTPRTMLLIADQGALVTVNGGESWSSWYNQPTAQFYHVIADNAFPYRVCGGQQESGSACVLSRGPLGQITFRDWSPVGVDEYGYVAPDPLDPDIIYGGRVTRWDRRTGQVTNVAPKAFRSTDYRTLRTAPLLFSPVNPRKLYFGTNSVWETVNGGTDWRQISPDLTRRDSVVPPNVGSYAALPAATARHPGVVYTLAPSPKSERVLWAGTDDGLIHVTTDAGRSWTNVTPAGLVPWAKVSMLEASPFDVKTAYAAVNTIRLDDQRPQLWRTRDGGRTWTRINDGIGPGTTVNTIRADRKRAGLLFAGTEQQVFVSYDDGDRWTTLRRNMPATSIRDLWIKDDDLIAGTHGRGFWILDDIAPLRQHDALASGAVLYAPSRATRVRNNLNTDTPLPQEEPAAPNPPEGVAIDYWLPADVSGVVSLEIADNAGRVLRRIASDDPADAPLAGRNIPDYWIRPFQPLLTTAGAHRYTFDLRHAAPRVPSAQYSMAAVIGDTPREPGGSWIPAGRYVVTLRVGEQPTSQPLEVRLDPRVKTPAAGLARMYQLSRQLDSGIARAAEVLDAIRPLRAKVVGARDKATGPLADSLRTFEDRLGRLATAGATSAPSLARIRSELAQLFALVEEADAAPTTAVTTASREKLSDLATLLGTWKAALRTELPRLNVLLTAAALPEITP